MVDKFSVREGREVGHAQVNTHIFIGDGKWHRFDFTGEDAVPVLPVPFHRQCLDLAFHLAVHLHLDGTNVTEREQGFALASTLRELPACMIGIRKRVILIATLEPGVAGCFPGLAAAEERLEGIP